LNGPVRIGILGCARIAKAGIIEPARELPELEVMAIGSRDQARSTAYASEHGIARAHGSYEALLADPELDAIYNPLPNGMHMEWTIRALEAGKAVLCEKPLAANAADAQRMVDAARACGRPLVEAFHWRYHPLGLFIAKVVQSGRLGRLVDIDAGLHIPGKLVPKGDIRFQAGLAGGATMDLGAYCINALRLVAGQEPRIEEATATLVSEGVDGATRARMRFASGVTGRIDCSLIADELKAWLNVRGERGRLEVNNPFLPQLGHRLALNIDGARTEQVFDRTPTYLFQAREFCQVVRGEAPARTTAEDGVLNMAAIDAVYRAAALAPRT
jgi:predicted dehydrogenase